MMKKLRYKYYNKHITTRDIGNVRSHDQDRSKLNSAINANSDAFNKNNVVTFKSK